MKTADYRELRMNVWVIIQEVTSLVQARVDDSIDQSDAIKKDQSWSRLMSIFLAIESLNDGDTYYGRKH